MWTELYWVEGRGQESSLSARPRGGDWLGDEMLHWKQDHVGTVVSLLEPDEASELELGGEELEVRKNGMSFLSIPIEDRQVPRSQIQFARQLEQVEQELARGKNVALHCRQGIGRAGLVAASLLMLQGFSAAAAVTLLSAARGLPVPETAEQRSWLDSFAASFALAR